MLKLFTSHKILKYTIAAVLLTIPLYPKFPFLTIPGTYVSVRLEDFLIAWLGIIVLLNFSKRIRESLRDDIIRAIFIYLFIGLISLAAGIFLTKTVSLHIGFLHWARRIEYFIPFFVGMLAFRGKDTPLLEFFLKIFMLVILLAFIYGLGQKYLNWPVIITQNEEYSKGIALRWVPGSHLNSTFAGHYDLATFLVFLLPILVTLLFLLKDKLTRITLLLVIFSGLWLLVNAISRISIVSYMLGSVLSLLLVRKYKAIVVVLFISVIFFGFSSDLLARYLRLIEVGAGQVQKIEKLFYNFSTTGTAYAVEDNLPLRRNRETPTPTPAPVFEDRSTSIRLNVEWPRAIRAFSKNPLLGTGFSSITLATDSDFLRLLGEVGVLGLFSFLLIFLRLGALIVKSLPFNSKIDSITLGFLSGTIGGIAGVVVNSFFIDVFEASKFAIIFWMTIGIAVSLFRITNNEQSN